MGKTTELKERWERTMTVLRAPKVRIDAFGGPDAFREYQDLTARHARLRVVPAKRWGVALIHLPATFDDYLSGSSRKVVRQKRRSAMQAGLHYDLVRPLERLDEIMAVNLSAPTRQGRPMSTMYTDRERVARELADVPVLHAVLDERDRLRAYTHVPCAGDVFIFSKVLGHADDLEAGIIYLLMTEVIRDQIARRDAHGSPNWAMYDTFWGASKGLAYYKERLGFRPYTVDWCWKDEPAPTAMS